MSYQQIVKNADGSIKINMPFYDLYTSGKKITLEDLEKNSFFRKHYMDLQRIDTRPVDVFSPGV